MNFRLICFLSLALCVLLVSSAEQDIPPFTGSKSVAVMIQPINVSGIPHSQMLRPLGGWILSSKDPDFGGLSALSVRNGRLTALADTGVIVSFAPDWRTANIHSLPDGCAPHQRKKERDSESLTSDPATGQMWIGLEYRNAICRIDPNGSATAYAPPAMHDWPILSGPEAMARLQDGRFAVFAESNKKGGAFTSLLLFDRDPVRPDAKIVEMRYKAWLGYHASDLAVLPDGRMLVLNRRFERPFRFSSILTLIEPFAAKPDAVVKGRPVIVLAPPLLADNFEGVEVEKRGDRTFIWLVSDDNFLPQQRTYLLKFELVTPRSGSDGR